MIPSFKLTALVATLVAASTACDRGGDPTGDALGLGQGEHDVCVPAPSTVERGTMFGDSVLENRSDSAVTISAVELVEPQGMRLREAALVMVEPGADLIGIRHVSNSEPLPASWDNRVPAEGAVVRPGEEWNLVPIVESDAEGVASAKATRIYYETANGKKFQQDTITALLVTTGSCEDALARWSR